MSALTDRIYRTWLASNGSRGYGAPPHESEAKRRGGVTDRPTAVQKFERRATGPCGVVAFCVATSRTGSQRANDAASRPEKPAVQSLPHSPFYPKRKNLQSNQDVREIYIV